METKISFLWKKCKYRVKAFNRMNYDIHWGKTYQEEELARKKDQEFNQKIGKYQIEAWAFFGLFIIELNLLFEKYIETESVHNFELHQTSQIYKKGKKDPITINKIKDMIKFMRHGFCHPEEKSRLRLDPYISNRLNRKTEDQDRSYHRIHFLNDSSKNDYYVQIGDGKLYFKEIKKAIRIANKILKNS